MADRILAWHVACGSGIMTVNSPSGNRPTLQSDTWLWDDMSLNSPGGNTLQCGMCLWNHDSEFAPWQHPAMWQADDMPWNSPKTSAIWNSTSGSHFDHITAVDMSFCTSLKNLSKSDHPRQKKITSCRFSRWRFSNNGFFKKPMYTTSYRSSIEIMALNCLVFEKKSRFCILATSERQTDRRIDGQACCMKPLSLSRAAV